MQVDTQVLGTDLGVVADRMARVPDRYRQFGVTAARAQRFYRVPHELLEQLLDLGMASRGTGEERLFDGNDLKSIAFLLNLRSPQRSALEAMAACIQEGATGRIHRTVEIQAQCPYPGHETHCDFVLAAEIWHSEAVSDIRQLARGHFEIDVELVGEVYRFLFTDLERELFTEVNRLEFHYIPFELNTDLSFLADSGLANCRLAAHFAATRGRQLGVPIRSATGLVLSRPFANRHFWVELQRDGRSLPADPFFLKTLAGAGLLDPQAWQVTRSPVGAYWRVDMGLYEPVIAHRAGTPVTFLTR